jgi:beta-phosphoglucomutase-like phosphatase (HAD superfamily)
MYDLKTQYFAACPPAEKMAGVESLMKKIKDCNCIIGVVTGSGQHTLLDRLEQSFPGLLKKELMVTSMDVKRGKPNPEPYLIGMQKCGVKPWETVVVENAPLGVRAAVAAQCFTIAVNTGPLPDEMLAQEGANLIFPQMPSLALAYHQWYPSECRG